MTQMPHPIAHQHDPAIFQQVAWCHIPEINSPQVLLKLTQEAVLLMWLF